MRQGPLNLITDVAGLRGGNAQDAALRSGVTVLTADRPFAISCLPLRAMVTGRVERGKKDRAHSMAGTPMWGP